MTDQAAAEALVAVGVAVSMVDATKGMAKSTTTMI